MGFRKIGALSFHLFLFTLFLYSTVSLKAQLLVDTGSIDAELKVKNGKTELEGSSVLKNEGYYVWGGSVVQGRDGKYHMFYSRWPKSPNHEPFNVGWLTDSEIAYAVSDYSDRDFKFIKVVLDGRESNEKQDSWDSQSVHNPHIKAFQGRYYLYYTGSKDPGPLNEGSPGTGLSRRDRIQQNQKIGVIGFDTFEELLDGDFERPDTPLLSPRTRVKPDNIIDPSPEGVKALPDNIIVVNPSVVYRESDKKYLLYFKGNTYDPYWKGVHGVALSDSPEGPFQPLNQFMFNLRDNAGKIASAEDPYVWYNPTKMKFYAVFKDFTGQFTNVVAGLATMTSNDGINWEKAIKPLFTRLELKLKNGNRLPVKRLERPQLLIDKDGYPTVLYSACSIKNPDEGTFNVQIPLVGSDR